MIETVLVRTVLWCAELLEGALLIRAIMSWFVRDQESVFGKIYYVLIQLTEPYLYPFRKLMEKYAGNGVIDWSFLIAFMFVQVFANVICRIIMMIF